MRNGANVHEERDSPCASPTRLEVIDNQRRLFLVVYVQAGAVATHVNPDPRPRAWHEVHVGLVLRGRLRAEAEPRPVRVGDVLGCVIASLLVVGAAIGGTQVQRVVRVAVQSEGDAREATSTRGCSRRRGAGDLHLDDAIREFEAVDDDEVWRTGSYSGLFFLRQRAEPLLGLLVFRESDLQCLPALV